jgi:xanthine/uracil permease
MNSDSNPSSLPNLLRELRDETTTLLRQEVSLAKAELKENATRIGAHSIQIAIGGFVGYAGLIVLLIGVGLLISSLLVRAGMDRDLAQWLAPALVGAFVVIIGVSMVSHAKKAMAEEDLAPRQTVETLRENKHWAQGKLQHTP